MRIALLVVAFAASISTAQAEWVHDADASEAAELSDGHKLAVSCSGRDNLTVYYAVPSGDVRDEIQDVDLILMVSTGSDGVFQSYNASSVDYGNTVGFGFRGPGTRQAARKFASASTIHVGLALRDHGENFNQYNAHTFSGSGSSDAIRSLLASCGID